MNTWQSIESAPRDGTVITAAKEGQFKTFPWPLKVKYMNDAWCAQFGTNKWPRWIKCDPQPTHWKPHQPLPEPPSDT